MGMTMSQKIIAAHCGKSVKVGEFVEARLDVVLGNDHLPVAINSTGWVRKKYLINIK